MEIEIDIDEWMMTWMMGRDGRNGTDDTWTTMDNDGRQYKAMDGMPCNA